MQQDSGRHEHAGQGASVQLYAWAVIKELTEQGSKRQLTVPKGDQRRG